MKATISKNEYLQLVGLLALAHKYKKMCDDAQQAMEDIIGEDNEVGSHSGDMIWEKGTIDELLKNLKIKVNGSQKLHN